MLETPRFCIYTAPLNFGGCKKLQAVSLPLIPTKILTDEKQLQ